MNHDMTRRDAIGGMAAIGALGFAGSAANAAQPKVRPAHISPAAIGFDATTREYTLPALPYAYDALEPIIDEQTMRIHHDKHHAGYVRGANNAIRQLESIRLGAGDAGLIQHWQRQLSFHMGGHINHTLFWSGMKPEGAGGGGQPAGNLANQIINDFGSFGNFTKQFTSAATKVEGSGWGWLVYEPASKQLMVVQMQNQQDMMFTGAIPLLGVDVWEHAYYLKYQNRRADYVEAFMRVVDWEEISRRFESARS
ncbi:MAG: superoxide dismutase [Phycisphaerales bacterium JB052]